MNTRRTLATVSAIAFGLALAGAMPAMAQNATTGGTNAAPQTSATPGAATPAAPSATPMSNMNRTGTTGAASGTSTMGTASKAAPTHHATHMARATHARTMQHHTAMSTQNPGAQDAAVARLNDMSLQAAQQGHSFTPSGGNM